MEIRQIKKRDFSLLYYFWKASGLWIYPREEEKRKFDSMFSLHPSLFFGLFDATNTLCGSVIGAYDGRTVTIHRLVVDPKYRRKGYGKLLVSALEEEAKEYGIQKIAGQVHITNTHVLGFYEKLGYKQDTVVTVVKKLHK